MPQLSVEAFNQLVDALYRSALDPGAWGRFLSMFSTTMGGVWTCIQAHDHRANINIGFLAGHWDPEFVASYRDDYARINPWNAATLRSRVGEAQPSEALVDPHVLRRSQFYNEWVKPQEDIGTGAGITIHRDRKAFMRFSCNVRSRDQERLQTDLVRVLNLLAPHLQRTFVITRHLGGQRLTSELGAVLDSANGAVLLIDASGRLHRANRHAERARVAGSYRLDKGGRVVMHDPEARSALARAIFAIDRGDRAAGGRTFNAHCADGRVLSATVSPLVQTDDVLENVFDQFNDGRPVAILCLSDRAGRSNPSVEGVQRLLGLTPAEAAVALSLYEGGTLQAYAEAKAIRVDTVRKQLGSIFDKTGTSKQSQLVSLIARMT